MPRAPVSDKNDMRGPAGPPPTEGLAYAGHEAEMPDGGMTESGSMGPVEASEMPAASMDDGPDTTATAPVETHAVGPSDMPGSAALLLSAGMVQGAVGMAIAGMGMNTHPSDAAISGNGMPGGTTDVEPGVPGAGTNGVQPGTGEPAAGEMPGNAATPGVGASPSDMPGTPAAVPGAVVSQEVQLSGTWRLTLTIGGAGEATGTSK